MSDYFQNKFYLVLTHVSENLSCSAWAHMYTCTMLDEDAAYHISGIIDGDFNFATFGGLLLNCQMKFTKTFTNVGTCYAYNAQSFSNYFFIFIHQLYCLLNVSLNISLMWQ